MNKFQGTLNRKINPAVYEEQKVWGAGSNEDYFRLFRSKTDDLYRSERFFLPNVIMTVKDCLDVGCCCGGFHDIMKFYNPSLRYTGVDIIARFIDIARTHYPDSDFFVGDGASLDFSDNAFELVHSSGILHLNSRYQDIVREMYRVASKYILCDFRLTEGCDATGEMDVNLLGQEPAAGVLPYVVLNIERHLEFLKTLRPVPAAIKVRGYAHPPSNLARINVDKIYMAFFLIVKGGASGAANGMSTTIEMNLDE